MTCEITAFPRPPSDGEDEAVATAEQLASINFEPIENAGIIEALTHPEWGQTTAALSTNLRIAAHIIGKTKAEMVTLARGLDNEALFETCDCLHKA